MRPIQLLLLSLLVTLPSAFALDKEAINALLNKPHSRKNLIPELKIYTDIRKFEVEVTFHPADGDAVAGDSVIADEKVVEGRYVVSEWDGGAGKLVMVVTYDQKKQVYLKYVLLPDGNVHPSVGISPEGSRAIAWRQSVEGGAVQVHSFEQHSDKGVTWTEIVRIDEKVLNVIRGTARAAKVK